MKNYYVYIMSNNNKTLYTGVTNNIERRIVEHKEGLVSGFTKRYCCTKLVYQEVYLSIQEAILREKQIKRWRRSKKINLIETVNPDWLDLSM